MSGLDFIRERMNSSHGDVTPIYGTPVYISELNSGLYCIIGTWSVVNGDAARTVNTGDLFFVYNDALKYRVMRVYAEGLEILECVVGGQASDITTNNYAPLSHTEDKVTETAGVHGLRVQNGVIQYHNGTTWVTMSLDNFII